MPRRQIQRAFRTGSKRQTDWAFGFFTSAFIAIPANSKVLLSSIPSSTLLTFAPSTIIRTRGMVSVITDTGSATEQQIGSVGLALVSDIARAAGAASIPGPSQEATWDGWFVHQFFAQKFAFGTGVAFNSNAANNMTIDSKAMRKFETDQALVLMVQNDHATHAFDIAAFELNATPVPNANF